MTKKILIYFAFLIFLVFIIVLAFSASHDKISSVEPEITFVATDTEGDFYTSDNVRLHYLFYNRGTPIVTIFLHGGPGSSTADFREIGQAERYADEFGSLLIFDQRGGGKSDKDKKLFSTINFPRFIQDINELRTALIPEHEVVMYGRSFGGLLAVRYAASEPTGVKGYILAAPGSFSSDAELLENQRQTLIWSVGEDKILKVQDEDKKIIMQIATDFGSPVRIAIPPLDDEINTDVSVDDAFRASGDYFVYSEYPLLTNLESIPTLVEYGSYDTQVPPLSIEAMKPYLPNATFLELPGGHGAAYAHEEEFFAAVKELFEEIW